MSESDQYNTLDDLDELELYLRDERVPRQVDPLRWWESTTSDSFAGRILAATSGVGGPSCNTPRSLPTRPPASKGKSVHRPTRSRPRKTGRRLHTLQQETHLLQTVSGKVDRLSAQDEDVVPDAPDALSLVLYSPPDDPPVTDVSHDQSVPVSRVESVADISDDPPVSPAFPTPIIGEPVIMDQYQAASQQAHDHMQQAQVTVSVPELMQWMRDNGVGTPTIAHKSAKGPDTMFFSAAGARLAEDLELFRTSLSLKFDAESD